MNAERSGDGWTLLHCYVIDKRVDFVKQLLEHKANPNAKARWGYTALHYAASLGWKDKVPWLSSGNTALQLRAGCCGQYTVFVSAARLLLQTSLLLQFGARDDMRNTAGRTALDLAVCSVACRRCSRKELQRLAEMVFLWWLVQLAHHPKDTVLHDLLQVGAAQLR